MKKLRKVIFLDIDGVLQPGGRQKRFDHDLEKLREDLAVKYNNKVYLEMDRYDLGAVYYDWDKAAVERLRKLCIEVPTEIVISSAWRRSKPLPRLKDCFKLHNLDMYLTGEIPQIPEKGRCHEITVYLNEHQDIERFAILDDDDTIDFRAKYPGQFVYCSYVFDEECYQKALDILTKPGDAAT